MVEDKYRWKDLEVCSPIDLCYSTNPLIIGWFDHSTEKR